MLAASNTQKESAPKAKVVQAINYISGRTGKASKQKTQLYYLSYPDGVKLYFSYDQVVGLETRDSAYVTAEKYSKTTSRHVTMISRLMSIPAVVPQEELDLLVKSFTQNKA